MTHVTMDKDGDSPGAGGCDKGQEDAGFFSMEYEDYRVEFECISQQRGS